MGRCDGVAVVTHPGSRIVVHERHHPPPAELPPETVRLILADGLLTREAIMSWLALGLQQGVPTWVAASRLQALAQAGIAPQQHGHLSLYCFGPLPQREPRLLQWLSPLLALLSLPLLLPLLLLVALRVALADGAPLLFAQRRTGRGGRRFTIYKFRTMQQRSGGRRQATASGERLRRCGLDELPQLFNLLRGNMLLLGPRPLPLTERNEAVKSAPWVKLRERVTPGLTGLYQVAPGRRQLGLAEMCQLDFYWLCHRSPRFNIWILLRTFKAMWRGWGRTPPA